MHDSGCISPETEEREGQVRVVNATYGVGTAVVVESLIALDEVGHSSTSGVHAILYGQSDDLTHSPEMQEQDVRPMSHWKPLRRGASGRCRPRQDPPHLKRLESRPRAVVGFVAWQAKQRGLPMKNRQDPGG